MATLHSKNASNRKSAKAYEKKAKLKKIKLQQIATFTQQLSSMLDAGLPIMSALHALEEQCENPNFRIIIRKVRKEVSTGRALSEACSDYPNAFPKLLISMVKAGEVSGALPKILEKTSDYFEKTIKLLKKIRGAMIYPALVIGLGIFLVIILLIFVIPVFSEMFTDFDAELPKPTQMLIDASAFLKSYSIFILGLLFLLFLGLRKFIKTPKGRIFKDSFILKIPIMGELTRKINLSRFCRTFAILRVSGVPILHSIQIVSNTTNNSFIEATCKKISKEISQGNQISDVLAQDTYFPPMIRHMAKAGERIGDFEGMMIKVSDFYDNEIDNLVATLLSMIEPLIISFLGIVVGGMIMAIFLPIFELSNVAGN